MSREKLIKLGLNLPLLPTTSVGSLPKPDYILKARAQYARSEIQYEELKKFELKATAYWVIKQDEIGLDIIVDGEMYRGDMVAYFAEMMKGFQKGELIRSYGNRYYRKPIIADEVSWCGPITVDWWKYAQSLTKKPVKGMLTGPYTIMDWSFNEFYPTRYAATIAIAHELRKEVEALVETGAKIIQVDEPAISTRTDELEFAREALNIVTDNIDAYFICHICYGNFAPVYKYMLSLGVDNLDLETSPRIAALEDFLKDSKFTKDISYGVIDVHQHKPESSENIISNIRHALTLFDRDSIWIDPDCGLKTRTLEEAVSKLTNMQKAADKLRQEI